MVLVRTWAEAHVVSGVWQFAKETLTPRDPEGVACYKLNPFCGIRQLLLLELAAERGVRLHLTIRDALGLHGIQTNHSHCVCLHHVNH